MSTEVQPEQRRFGRFVVTGVLGEGAMGTVFSARDEVLGRIVAIKTIRAAGGSALRNDLFRKRFQQEARAVAALSHANIVQLFEMGFEDDAPYLVMELIRGRSLRARIDGDGPLSIAEARTLGIQIARALQAAHEQGVMHRDVKPANILEAEPGLWKLSDFGVAHVPSSSLTIDGQFVGTPAYAAPEALLEGSFGPATDVYGLGATLYDALTGQPPFGRAALASLATEATAPPISAHRGDSSPDLDACLLAALARTPTERPSVAEFASLLARAGAGAVPAAAAAAAAVPVPGAAAAAVPVPGAAAVPGAVPTAGAAAAPAPAPAPAPVAAPAAVPGHVVHAAYPYAHAAVTLSGGPPPARAGVAGSSGRNSLVLALVAAAALIGIGFYCGSSDAPPPVTATPPMAAPAATDPVEELEALWDQANRKLKGGDVEGALEDIETLLERDPESPQVRQLHDYLHALQDAQQEGARPAKPKGKGKGKGKHAR